ncbi:MAG: hypothetical protein K6T61_09620 [Bryobacteraceae bacterium]|nr:hypothetical protein [Bryobacteraceae bacterium]
MYNKNRRLAAQTLAACLALTAGAQPSSAQERKVWKKLWAVSVTAVAAANIADAGYSLGRGESNPLLRNAQGGLSAQRVVLIKSAGTGGMILLQYILRKRMPEEKLDKPAAIINFAAAGAVGAVAYRNSKIPTRPAASP